MHGHGDARIGRCAAASSQCKKKAHLGPSAMANHQQALVRYVTLDDCLGHLRLSKDELMDRCSRAVDRVSGGGRRISERTFFSDIKAMREGIILGREAPIECVDGMYFYTEQGFTMFRAGDAEVEELLGRLADREQRAQKALAYLKGTNIDKATYDTVVGMLMGEEAELWMLRLDEQEREKMAGDSEPRVQLPYASKDLGKDELTFGRALFEQRKVQSHKEAENGSQVPTPEGSVERDTKGPMLSKPTFPNVERPLIVVQPGPEDPSAWALHGWGRSRSEERRRGLWLRFRTWLLVRRLRMGLGRP